jgi:hypothetical protein
MTDTNERSELAFAAFIGIDWADQELAVRFGGQPVAIAKSDPSDANLLADLLVRHREKLRRFDPDTTDTRMLQFLVEGRRKLVNDKTRYSNRLTAHFKMYFPQVPRSATASSCSHGRCGLIVMHFHAHPGTRSPRRNCPATRKLRASRCRQRPPKDESGRNGEYGNDFSCG